MSTTFQPPDKKELSTKYEKVYGSYKRLITEILFILEKTLDEQKIKIHSIRKRIKDFDSFYNKIVIKEIREDPFEKINDIAGIRIICLYRSDLERVGKLISEQFDVVEADVKTKASAKAEFGYMSDHYVVKLPEGCKGARYDEIKPLKCEIQVRTILMDAWDSVSHHLDYKKEIDVPSQLKKDFYALSGLFYVADTHFELFKDSVENLRLQLTESVEKDQFNLNQEMNLDTLRAYLAWKLPDREKAEDIHLSDLLSDLQKTGYFHFRKLDEALNKSLLAAEAEEKDEPPHKPGPKGEMIPIRYNQVGLVRGCLKILDHDFLKYWAEKMHLRLEYYKKLEKYRPMIRT